MSDFRVRGSTASGFGAGFGCVFGVLAAIALVCGGVGLFIYAGIRHGNDLRQPTAIKQTHR